MSLQSKNGHHCFKQEKANSSCGAYKKSNYCLGNTEKRERGQGAGPITLGRRDQNQENVIQSDQPDHCHMH